MTGYKTTLLLAIFLLLPPAVCPADTSIGEVVFARGVVSAQVPGAEVRVLGKDAPLFRGDVITTGPKSFTVIKLHDGSRISIRPKTVYAINEYNQDSGQENFTSRLFKGGLRAISGLISKNNPDAFQMETAVATIGIRGTEFDVRMCEDDCVQETGKTNTGKSQVKSKVIARVVFLKGTLTAINEDGNKRNVSRGGPIYEGDELETGHDSYTVIVFRDQGRVTLKADTKFKIDKFKFDAEGPEEDGLLFRLIKGGMRSVTGLISKNDPDAHKIETAVATIGIRGTGLDLLWLGPCTSVAKSGLLAHVWEGGITADNDSGKHDISLNQTAKICAIDLPPEFISTPPVFVVPRPDKVEVDFENLFGSEARSETEPGLYVACYDGHCIMLQEQKSLDLGAGEAGYASLDGRMLVRLDQIEPFQANDPYLNTINELFDTLYELLDEKVMEQTEFECVVQ